METVVQDIRYAIRTLLKAPGFTAVAALTLALGIGANTAIFSVLYGVLLRPLPYPEPRQLVGFVESYRGNRYERDLTFREFAFVRDNATAFSSLAVETEVGLNLFSGGEAERVSGLRVSRDYFRTLGAEPALGRDFTADDDQPGGPNRAILSNGLWRARFGGDSTLVGRTIILDGAPFAVVGVLPAGFHPLTSADIWTTVGQVSRTIGSGENLRLVARLKPGLSPQAARGALTPLLTAWRGQFTPDLPADAQLSFVDLHDIESMDLAGTVRLLFGAIGLVLLIACANVANLVLGRATTRQREMAVRVAVGASRGRLVRQLLTESLVLAALGGACAAALAAWGLDVLVARIPAGLTHAVIRLDGWALLFTAGAALITGVAFGFVPAWHAARGELQGALKEAGRSTAGAGQGRLRGSLVVAEVALSIVLLAGAGLLIRSMGNMLRTNPGFDASHLVTAEIWLTGSRYDSTVQIAGYYDRLRQRLEATPGVRSAAVIEAGLPLLRRGGNMGAAVDGAYPQETIEYRTVTPGYFATLGIPVKAGRAFTDADVATSEPVAIVSEMFARRFLTGDPLSHTLTAGGRNNPPRRIVGVVGNVRQMIINAGNPFYYLPSAQTPGGLTRGFSSWYPIHVVVRTSGDPQAMKPLVARGIRVTDPLVPMGRVRTMDEVLANTLALHSFEMLLLSVFAGLAIALAAVGIYGVMSYLVAQRSHEIGVRMALGALPREVLGLVLGRGMMLAAGGAALGLLGSVAVTRVLGSQLYGVQPADPPTLAVVTLLLLLVALSACLLPARRATRVDPLVALRSE